MVTGRLVTRVVIEFIINRYALQVGKSHEGGKGQEAIDRANDLVLRKTLGHGDDGQVVAKCKRSLKTLLAHSDR